MASPTTKVKRPVKAKPFEFNGTQIQPGSVYRTNIPVARLPSDTEVCLPVALVCGAMKGPTIWLSAAIHGDELIGVPVIHQVLQVVNANELAGTLITVPVVNVFGLINESRYLPDGRDLNRSFPGSRRGSLASQLANLMMTEVVNRCELGIDLHTGSDGRTNLPQIRCDLDDKKTLAAAKAFAAPVTLRSGVRPGTLRAAAVKSGKRILLYEAGEAGRFQPGAIEQGIDGVLRVMQSLKMLTGAPPGGTTVCSRSSGWVRASRSGFCRLRVELGASVRKGELVATTFDVLGLKEQRVLATRSGIVVGHLQGAVVHRGDALVHVAEV